MTAPSPKVEQRLSQAGRDMLSDIERSHGNYLFASQIKKGLADDSPQALRVATFERDLITPSGEKRDWSFLPKQIGRLELGELLSVDEAYCWHSHEIPDGAPLYWPIGMGENDDHDPYCLEHAIAEAESDSSHCQTCIAADLAAERSIPSGDAEGRVLIWSGEHHAYWRPDSAGYVTDGLGAGLYPRGEAESILRGVGPEKRLEIREISPAWPIVAALTPPPAPTEAAGLREAIERTEKWVAESETHNRPNVVCQVSDIRLILASLAAPAVPDREGIIEECAEIAARWINATGDRSGVAVNIRNEILALKPGSQS